MKRLIVNILFGLALLLCVSCDVPHPMDFDNPGDEITGTMTLDDLTETDYFQEHALEHIFIGEINSQGQAVGFHYEGLENAKGEVIPGSASSPNEYGVYEAKVMVNDIEKVSNHGKSTFFPKSWEAQKVLDAINVAYENKVLISGNTYEGLTEEGITIRMYLDKNNLIISAFPQY